MGIMNLNNKSTTVNISNVPKGYYVATVYYDNKKFNQNQLIK